jgi:threonine-phosphate decarboxylase
MITGHGGNIFELAERLGCAPSDIIDMSSNMNPLGPPPGLLAFLAEHISAITILPDVSASGICRSFAERHNLDPETVLAGNGTTQLIHAIPAAIGARNVLILAPTYADYADACRSSGIHLRFLTAEPADDFRIAPDRLEKELGACDTVFICNPNNPTGVLIPADLISTLLRRRPEVTFIVDESYLPFAPDGESESVAGSSAENLIVLNSMSKIFRIPGLRIGFLVAGRKLIDRLSPFRLPWSVNALAQAAVRFLMERPEETARFVRETRRYIEAEKKTFTETLDRARFVRTFPSTTAYFIAVLSGGHTSASVCAHMARERILLRNCDNFAGLSNRFIRISLKTAEINRIAREKLVRLLDAPPDPGSGEGA